MRILYRLYQLLKSPMLIPLAVGAVNIGLFIYQVQQGVPLMQPAPSDLLAWGGDLAPLTLNGESWRLFTSIFLHVGLPHLAANMFMLYSISPAATARYGRMGFTLIYFLGGLGASLISAWWAVQNLSVTKTSYAPFVQGSTLELQLIVSAGASGAIMAVCGALIVVWLRSGAGSRDADFHRNLVQTIALNVLLGFVLTGVDQAAHLGGLVLGFLLGMTIGLRGNKKSPAPAQPLRMVLASIVTLLGIWKGIEVANTEEAQSTAARIRAEARPDDLIPR